MKYAKSVFFFLFLNFSLIAFAQREIEEDTKPSFKDRVYVGGGFAMNGGRDGFGNSYFYFALNPIIGYMITPKFSAGTGIGWQQYNYTDAKIKFNQYAVSPFLRYNLNQLFLYSEYNLINTPSYVNPNLRSNYDRLLLGLGYTQPLGTRSRGAINGMVLYDVLYNQADRAFASPWVFRVYVSF